MFRYNFYESRLNSFKVIVIIPFITPIYPLNTPISGTNTRGILEDFWYVFLCCLNNICWNVQLVTNLFQVSMSCRLIPLDYNFHSTCGLKISVYNQIGMSICLYGSFKSCLKVCVRRSNWQYLCQYSINWIWRNVLMIYRKEHYTNFLFTKSS